MPFRRRGRKSPLRKRRGAKRVYRRRQVNKRSGMNAEKDKARVVEVEELSTVVTGGSLISHQLSQFPRANAVSQNFRFFRCTKVEVEFMPYANVFAPGQAFPEVYFQVDRTASLTNPGISLPLPTKASMLSRGCLPVKWTKPIKRFYSPSVLRLENLYQSVTATTTGTAVAALNATTGTPVKYKWYERQSYNPSFPTPGVSPVPSGFAPDNLVYMGAAYYVDSPIAEPGILGTIKMKVHWEFKEPLVVATH